jgi:hypothetical protein
MSAGSLALLLVLGAEPRWGLTFKAPDGCIQAPELAELIEARLGRALFGANPDVRIDAWLKASEPPARWRARLTLVDADGTVKGTREVTSNEVGCRSIDASLALVAAVMIDPASALKGTSGAAVEPELPPPPPPPSSQGGPEARAPLKSQLPRDAWPGYIRVDGDSFYQDGRLMLRNAFYRAVGRADLDDAYLDRVMSKSIAYIVGSAALTTGAVFLLVQASNVSCVRWSGTPEQAGTCLEKAPWPWVTGLSVAAVGLAAVLFAALFRAVPTTPDEDVELAEQHNRRLKPPATAGP